jgi:hypothetical protein
MEQERRRVPRFQFIAPAELVEEKSGVAVSSWVSDLGVGGCSLGMKDPPPLGTEVRLTIGNNPREIFEAKAQIVHSNPNHVGVAFFEVKPMSSLVLHKWLASAKFPKGHA